MREGGSYRLVLTHGTAKGRALDVRVRPLSRSTASSSADQYGQVLRYSLIVVLVDGAGHRNWS